MLRDFFPWDFMWTCLENRAHFSGPKTSENSEGFYPDIGFQFLWRFSEFYSEKPIYEIVFFLFRRRSSSIGFLLPKAWKNRRPGFFGRFNNFIQYLCTWKDSQKSPHFAKKENHSRLSLAVWLWSRSTKLLDRFFSNWNLKIVLITANLIISSWILVLCPKKRPKMAPILHQHIKGTSVF